MAGSGPAARRGMPSAASAALRACFVILVAAVASGAMAQSPRSDSEVLQRVERAGQVTAAAAACGARIRQVDLVMERAGGEAIRNLGPSRTDDVRRAARRGVEKSLEWTPAVGSPECRDAMRAFSDLSAQLERR